MGQWAIDALGLLSQVLLAGVLLFAALSKVLAVGELGGTLERLGARPGVAGPAAVGVIAAEIAAAAGLMASPTRAWPRLLAAVLAAGFAAAALRALSLRQQIPCNCFGTVHGAVLGWRQVRLLALWVPLLVLAQWRPPAWDLRSGLVGLASLVIGLACAQLPGQLALWRKLRGDRMAIDEGWRPVPATAAEGVGSS